MARKVKFSVAASSLLAVSTLILLSGPADCLQCYWCGPLAEQVHRSQRAPSCDAAPDQVTACEPGYTHCAVVASSPPYVESRYCVKFYQDECYTLYCNSTKTSRMTCPCRGELCNGPNTQREIEAFAVLTKAVAKTQNTKIKKRNAIFSNNLAKSNKDRMASLIQNDVATESMTTTEATSDRNESAVENEITEHIKVSDLSDDDSTMQADQPSIEEPKNGNTEVANNEGIESPSMMMPTTQTPQSETQKDNKPSEMTTSNATEESNEADAMKATESTMGLPQTRNVEANSFISNDIKPNMELPTAEALQQNSGPLMTSEKSMEQTTSDSTVMTTPQSATILVASTASTTSSTSNKPTEATRNSGVEVSVCMIVIIKSVAINFIVTIT